MWVMIHKDTGKINLLRFYKNDYYKWGYVDKRPWARIKKNPDNLLCVCVCVEKERERERERE